MFNATIRGQMAALLSIHCGYSRSLSRFIARRAPRIGLALIHAKEI